MQTSAQQTLDKKSIAQQAITQQSIVQRIAEELSDASNKILPAQVKAAITLLDEGATVPFIARYRKEVTGELSDTHLRTLEERLIYLREMEDRREAILKSIDEQGKLSPELAQQIREADSKARLEDLYLPYKQKRRTKGQIAREAGLEPLAVLLLNEPARSPETEAAAFVDGEKGVADIKAALDGAKYILMERFAENADLLGRLREYFRERAQIIARVIEDKKKDAEKFRDYFEHQEKIGSVPSHRLLAMLRGRNEGFLALSVNLEVPEGEGHPCEGLIAHHAQISNEGRAADKWLNEVVRWSWRIKLQPQLETELIGDVREVAEEDAIRVFAANLKDLLMAAPAGMRCTLGLDPGLRTGVKVVVCDNTGKLLEHTTIFPHEPRNDWDRSIAVLAALCAKHQVDLVSIGNGTASRETDKLTAELMKKYPELKLTRIVVSEAGASVYSASELAAQEFPTLDVTFRGAVSIARRLQDPLAELVKIEAKAIGVGQYQHDVSQVKLARSLDGVVEDCVNAVGVDVNTASVPLLARVAGLNTTIAGNIVRYRESNGAFVSREQLKQVPRLGERTFEQAAGFLRVSNADNPLDASGVHPEAYTVVQRIAEQNGRDLRSLLGDSAFLKSVNAAKFVDERFGLPTITDILKELDKPGRDPRPEFRAPTFQEGVETLADLKPGMALEGVVTNVTNFGAFVDIGVHQDGLVHISEMSDRFIKDPREVVKAGDIVKVRVQEVDIARKRIALTMKSGAISTDIRKDDNKPAPRNVPSARSFGGDKPRSGGNQSGGNNTGGNAGGMGSLGALLQKAGVQKK